jgi:hypothetical protein
MHAYACTHVCCFYTVDQHSALYVARGGGLHPRRARPLARRQARRRTTLACVSVSVRHARPPASCPCRVAPPIPFAPTPFRFATPASMQCVFLPCAAPCCCAAMRLVWMHREERLLFRFRCLPTYLASSAYLPCFFFPAFFIGLAAGCTGPPRSTTTLFSAAFCGATSTS